MPPGIVILLGRSIWTRDAGGWRRESFDAGPKAAPAAVARLGEILCEGGPRRWTVVFEPESLSHQAVETPKVSRSVFASLAKVRSEFPVVESEALGWGIEIPESTQGDAFSALMHAELTPGLAFLRDACSSVGGRLDAAWPAYTAAVACAQASAPAGRAKFLLIVAPDFVAVATCVPGKRSFKAWIGPLSERDWRGVSLLIGDGEARVSASNADPGLRRGAIAVIAAGDPQSLCPLWGEIHASGRVSSVFGMDALADGAAGIPRSHPANLAEAFPVPRELNRYLAVATSVGLSAALALCVLAAGARRQLVQLRASTRESEVSLEGRLETLTRNKDEMGRLRSEVPSDSGHDRISRHDSLVGLAASIPDALTLTSLALHRDNGFEIEAIVVGTGFDPEALRRAFERSGFIFASTDGWVFNAGAGRLAIRGKLGAPGT
jgi:hypothetical protein